MPLSSLSNWLSNAFVPPRKEMVDRFLESGREKLVVIVASDCDPEGFDIPNAFGLSLRDDFNLRADQLVIVKAALTYEQAQQMDLHQGHLAKESSSRFSDIRKSSVGNRHANGTHPLTGIGA